ncbi:biotin--[acetyl-CoA-carboxylase] ligase [Phenylobacterium sp.]|uniref:biotin--[acetyl-CoA-carboxylase] ligase n=1 Tax=Phenylobacterium sp. TaxID=1871053 RepID=UPI0027319067|nr:biotin--[acetyl-CoA-carboxylase] ligase [Phenylobacterium sp.]MDP2213103.1 biotin--[acetyl-CoA-carboxylase] ligase [Phenylobacterium sp.]
MATVHPPIAFFDELDSTNAEARRRAEAGDAGPLWIAAFRQTAGRGRRGRPWETGAGNLAATLLMTTDRPAGEAAQLSFVAALAAADLAESCLASDLVSVKWPNDLMIDGRKAAGILVESGARPDGRLWLAVGIGINLVSGPEAAERPSATFAEHMSGAPPTPQAALDVLAAAFETWRGAWAAQGFSAIADGWTSRAHGLGQTCIARLPNETVEGVAEGMDPDGALRLRLDDGQIRKITAGDVFFGDA